MVADYISTSFSHGLAFPAIVVARKKVGTTYDVAMYTAKDGLSVINNGPTFSSAGELPVLSADSGYGIGEAEDDEVGTDRLSDVFDLFPGFELPTLGSFEEPVRDQGLRAF